jgi:hypothetical protein
MTSRSIEPDQRGGGVLSEWEPNGYFRVGEFLSHGDCRRFIEAAQHLVRQGQGAIIWPRRFPRNEGCPSSTASTEQSLSIRW